MSAFGGKADMPCGLEVLSMGKHNTLAAHWAEIVGFLLGGNRCFADLAPIHSVQDHTDDDGHDGTTHTTSDQLTSNRCKVDTAPCRPCERRN